jgi:hypothetical protein
VLTDSPHAPLKMTNRFNYTKCHCCPPTQRHQYGSPYGSGDGKTSIYGHSGLHWTVLRISSSLRAGEQLCITFSDNIWTSRWFHHMYTKGETNTCQSCWRVPCWRSHSRSHASKYAQMGFPFSKSDDQMPWQI